jgi:hypothetical protein
MRSVGLLGPSGALGWLGSLTGGCFYALLFQVAMIFAISAALFWLVRIYDSALRDPRYLDGWILAVGMVLQLLFHVSNKRAWLRPSFATRWRSFHVFLGYLLIPVLISHTAFTLPDTGLEWALGAGFVLVALSGVFGIYLAWSLKARFSLGEHPGYDHIPLRRSEMARDIHAAVSGTETVAGESVLPEAPYDAWIKDLYASQLRDFFNGPRNFVSHLAGSLRPLRRLTDEIDNLSRYVDKPHQDKLATIRDLVVKKNREDFALVYLGLARAWPYVHVPVTYGLIVLTMLHVLVVYAFSSGAW